MPAGMLERDVARTDRRRFQGILLDVTEDEEAKSAPRVRPNESSGIALEGALVIPWAETIQPDTMGTSATRTSARRRSTSSGYTPEELMVESSTHFPRMVHPDDRARVRQHLRVAPEETGHLGGDLPCPAGATARSAGSIRLRADEPRRPARCRKCGRASPST